MRTTRTKYRNVRSSYNGVSYASKAEARRAAELDLLVQTGAIQKWIGQPTFRLGCPENVYRPDFLVVGRKGAVWCEDVKGVETAKFRRDKKLWASYAPCPLHVLHGARSEVIDGAKTPYPLYVLHGARSEVIDGGKQ